MGKSLPSTAKLQDFARIIASHKPHRPKHAPRHRVVPAPEPASKHRARVESERLRVNMEESSRRLEGERGRVPLATVVSDCVKRWFEDTSPRPRAATPPCRSWSARCIAAAMAFPETPRRAVLGSVKLQGVDPQYGESVINVLVTMLVTRIRMIWRMMPNKYGCLIVPTLTITKRGKGLQEVSGDGGEVAGGGGGAEKLTDGGGVRDRVLSNRGSI
ncbi:hypothetical protein Acr_02g0003060 [Actinidia rufa]|uniref:Uncharacterized protein n=1 Tax=Actinidia rufa TaxID=165716 RepID=A0A7J0E786_9ERIC|nr:hypothetical protein Acr_02g0003060 [Actinidia rufa]